MVEKALALAAAGFRVLPLKPGLKEPPLIEDYENTASSDPVVLRNVWKRWPRANPGISMRGLLGLDIDCKEGRPGFASLQEYPPLPATYWQRTPTGGVHLVYRNAAQIRTANTQGKLGKGLDTRGDAGYLVAAGAVVDNGTYAADLGVLVADAPAWLVEKVKSFESKDKRDHDQDDIVFEQGPAIFQAVAYLQSLKPAPDGQRDNLAFAAACVLREFGVEPGTTAQLMRVGFKATPPLSPEEIEACCEHAYRYASGTKGAKSPETVFPEDEEEAPPPPPASDEWYDRMNREYAFTIAGGSPFVLWDSTDRRGRPETKLIRLETFAKRLSNQFLQVGNRNRPIADMWMESPHRRQYDGITFLPGKQTPPNYFNLWRGFAFEPLGVGEKPTLEMERGVAAFEEHQLENVCKSIAAHDRWLTGWCAHVIQRPWEKSLVCVVLRGDKGSGKDSWADRIGALFPRHYRQGAKRRYLVGNFNGHLENVLLFKLTEAFWAHDFTVLSTLNDLVTNDTLMIERKGGEPYEVDNFMRIVMLGNADQSVPVTWDERRYSIFDVGNGRRRQKTFFRQMREDMEAGGYRYLLRKLLDFDLSTVDVNEHVETEEFHAQKTGNLDPVYAWWRESLSEGRILGDGFGGESPWPDRIDKFAMRAAYRRWRKDNEPPGGKELPENFFGRRLGDACSEIDGTQRRYEGTHPINQYALPKLARCVELWNAFMKFEDLK